MVKTLRTPDHELIIIRRHIISERASTWTDPERALPQIGPAPGVGAHPPPAKKTSSAAHKIADGLTIQAMAVILHRLKITE